MESLQPVPEEPTSTTLTPEQIELALGYMNLVHSIAWTVCKGNPYADIEEAVADGYHGLLQAAQSYDPQKAAFTTYAYLRIRGTIIQDGLQRQYGTEGQKPSSLNPRDRHLDTPLPASGQSGHTEESSELTIGNTLTNSQFTEPEDIITLIDIERATKKLTSRQREVLARYMQGRTSQEISEALDINQATVRGHLSRAAAIIREQASLPLSRRSQLQKRKSA